MIYNIGSCLVQEGESNPIKQLSRQIWIKRIFQDINSTDLGHMRILAGESEALQLCREVLLTALSPVLG